MKSKVSEFAKKYSNVLKYLTEAILAYIGTATLGVLLSYSQDNHATWGIVVSLLFLFDFVILFFSEQFIEKTGDKGFKRRIIWSVIMGLIFDLTLVWGYQLQYRGYTDPGLSGKVFVLLKSIALLTYSFPAFYYIFAKSESAKNISEAKKGEVKTGKIFLLSWLAIFIAYIPAFLAYYPMILSYDFHAQVLMAEGGFPDYWMHHPYLSTMMIAAFYYIGKAIGNISLGIAFMGIVHMIVSSAADAYMVSVVSRIAPKKWIPYALTALLALLPTNPVMVLCTTKDVIFSDLFIVFLSLVAVRLFLDNSAKKNIVLDILIVLSGSMASLWRNNMVYAVVAAGILVVIFAKKKTKLLVLVMTLLIFLGNKGGIAFLRDVVIHDQHIPNSIEMLSVVAQAFGRTVNYNKDFLSDEDKELINKYIPKEYWEEYYPNISDPMKNTFVYTYADSIDGKMGQLIKDFLAIGVKYPDQYLDSFLDTTRGFWFIDDSSFAEVLGYGLEGNMGIIYTYYSSESYAVEEIPHEAILPGVYLFYEKLISRNDVLKWPILNLLFKPAFYTLLIIFSAFLFIYKKEWKKLGFVSFPVMYIGTMFLGPVVQFRYVYPWMIGFWLILAITFAKE